MTTDDDYDIDAPLPDSVRQDWTTAHQKTGRAATLIPYYFNDDEYLVEALQAAGTSVTVRGMYLPDGNKRLALLGDAVIKAILFESWYETGQSRDVANRCITEYASNTNLVDICVKSHLNECITVNRSQANQKPGAALLVATIQAVVAAVWLDSGNSIDSTSYVMQKLGIFG